MERLNTPQPRSPQASAGCWRRLRCMGLLLLFAAQPVWSDAVISGSVTDILGQRVSGARITIGHMGQQLREGLTDGEGAFRLEIAQHAKTLMPGEGCADRAGQQDDRERPRRADHPPQLDQQRQLDGGNQNEEEEESTHLPIFAQGGARVCRASHADALSDWR